MNTELGSGLRVRGEIKVDTKDGQSRIELLFGDITKLPPDEKMDVVMVSAFPGDYSPVPGTLIGALKHNLDLSVLSLAQDRQEDLRKHFNCWWSEPLPEHLPYRQLLCFETPFHRSFRHPAELIGDVFRCLVPMFGNEAKTVITPLLSTGDQGFSKEPIIRALLDGAINWMRAGLPLKVLRIVVYAPDATYVEKEDEEVINFFQKYKKTVEAAQRKPKDPDLHYDVYMSYSEEDEGRVQKILQLLREEKSDLKIFSKRQHLNVEEAWQDDIYNTMTQCRSVVPFLSPNYLSSRECVEQFNIALVCNRGQKIVLLTPFLLESIVGMPTYMELVQYVDCSNDSHNEIYHPLFDIVSHLLTFQKDNIPNRLQLSAKARRALGWRLHKTTDHDINADWIALAEAVGVDDETVGLIQRCHYSRMVQYTCGEVLLMFWEYFDSEVIPGTSMRLKSCNLQCLCDLLKNIGRYDVAASLESKLHAPS